ncbi:hypothetical protein R6Q57_019308 [Mikania cordata]
MGFCASLFLFLASISAISALYVQESELVINGTLPVSHTDEIISVLLSIGGLMISVTITIAHGDHHQLQIRLALKPDIPRLRRKLKLIGEDEIKEGILTGSFDPGCCFPFYPSCEAVGVVTVVDWGGNPKVRKKRGVI